MRISDWSSDVCSSDLVDDDIHGHGWSDVTPVRPVVVAKFQLTLGVVLNQDAQLHATIQMPVQGVDLTGARRPLARRKCGGQCHFEGANVFLATDRKSTRLNSSH